MSFLYYVNRIYPYTSIAPIESDLADITCEQNTISILSANILMSNRNTGGFIKLVRDYDPDIVCVPESDKFWEKYWLYLPTNMNTMLNIPAVIHTE